MPEGAEMTGVALSAPFKNTSVAHLRDPFSTHMDDWMLLSFRDL